MGIVIDPKGEPKNWCRKCLLSWVNFEGRCPICGTIMVLDYCEWRNKQ